MSLPDDRAGYNDHVDEDAKKLLVEIRDAQREQLELLRKIYSGVPSWLNWRFSLMQLLVAMTIVAVIVAVMALGNR